MYCGEQNRSAAAQSRLLSRVSNALRTTALFLVAVDSPMPPLFTVPGLQLQQRIVELGYKRPFVVWTAIASIRRHSAVVVNRSVH